MPESEKPGLRSISSQSSAASRQSPSRSLRIERLYSGQHPDDQSYYHQGDHYGCSDVGRFTSASERHKEEKEDGVEAEREDGGATKFSNSIAEEQDVESRGARLSKATTTRSNVELDKLVTWEGPDDPANPKNWSFRRKWAATFIASSFTFISPVSSSMVAPALDSIAKDLKITDEVETAMVLSLFVCAFAIGPLFIAPISEIYGRVPVLQLANLFYLVFNFACGMCTSKNQMLAFRFLAGLGGSAPIAIGGGVLSDCWKAEERGKAISIYSLAPLLGPAAGPIAAGFITENTSWRWTFHATSIADVVIQISGLLFLQETYGPTILHKKAKRARKETGNDELKTEFEHPDLSLFKTLKRSVSRPFLLLTTQPIIQCLALFMAYVFGLMYLVLSTFSTLWSTRYGQSISIGGLNYISLGLGFFSGAQICAPLNDAIYRRLKKSHGDTGKPEYRVPLMIPGAVMVPIGLLWYGWSAQAELHWIMPNIGAFIFSAGTIVSFQCIQAYIIDAYARFAASGIAAAMFLRSLAGFTFPLFAPYMYTALDYGWGNSLLAFIAIGIGIPAPLMLWKFGAKLRARSRFAAG